MTEKKWYDGLYPEKDDALERGLTLLEDLRGALPAEKAQFNGGYFSLFVLVRYIKKFIC